MEGEKNPKVFKSTDIHSSRANEKTEYFTNVSQPTLQDKLRAKAQAKAAARAARAAKAQDPAVQKRRRKIAIAILAALIAIIIGLLAFFIIDHIITQQQEQEAVEQQEATNTAMEVGVQANQAALDNPEDGYNSATQIYKDKIANSTGELDKFYITIQYANYVLYRSEGGPEEALKIAQSIDNVPGDYRAQYAYNLLFWDIYSISGDEDAANKYRKIAEDISAQHSGENNQ